jgi:WS/DGAT/MGAT family acyltransferase
MTTSERMAAADAAWLHMDRPTNLMVVNSVFWFDRPLDWDAVASAFAERLVPAFPHFSQRVVEPPVTVGLVGPRWERVERFSVAPHLKRARLRSPGDDAQLHRYVSRQAALPLDPRRPLWQAHLIDGYRSGCAMLLRTHHALADGTALIQALLTLVDAPTGAAHAGQLPLAGESDRETWVEAAGRRAGRLAGTLLGGWGSALTNPSRALDGVLGASGTADVLTRAAFAGSDDPSVLRGRLSGDKQLTWSASLPLARVREAGRANGATVNDLALTAIAGALRLYLLERGQDVSQLTAVVPVNLRPLDQPMDPERGNQFGLAFVRLPVAEPDREGRLAAVKARMALVKSTHEAVIVYGALAVMGQAPTRLEQAWLDLFARRASAVITNIAGPKEPVTLAGVPLAGFVAWVPSTGPIGVGLSVCSYNGRLVLGAAVDRALVSDPDALLQALSGEFEQVLLLGAPGRRAQASRSAPRKATARS